MKLERIEARDMTAPAKAAASKQLFAPVPLRAMALDLSGLQLRVMICVAAHDRMSLVTGKGQGCRASNDRMKAMVGCDYSRLCSTLTLLVELGLLERDKLGRHTVYRVVYTDDDRLLFGNVSSASIGCQEASEETAIGCRDFPESGSFPSETPSQYIPLNGGRDSVETGEYISSEEARFAARRLSRREFADSAVGQMARLERALNVGAVVNNLDWYQYLEGQTGDENPKVSGMATRLADRVVGAMSDEEYQACGQEHGWADEQGRVARAASSPGSRLTVNDEELSASCGKSWAVIGRDHPTMRTTTKPSATVGRSRGDNRR